MTMKSVGVIRKEPGGEYFEDRLRDDLESFQAAVGGYIEAVPIHGASKPFYVICDEEGRLSGKPYNCTIAGINFVGPIVIVGIDGDEFADAPYDIEFMSWITTEAEP